MTDSISSHPVENKGRPRMPTLPDSFIPRPGPLNRIKTLLTDSASSTVVLSSRGGLGGMGKTSLALAIAQDETIQAAFPDGILWTNLGPEPEVLSSLTQWIWTLDERGNSLTTIAMASDQLRHWVKRRRMLLIVDEVYTLDHLEPFNVVQNTASRLLLTTRDLVVPQSETYVLEEMTGAQSQQFFEAQLKQSLEQRNRKDALQFAKNMGCLPLSLNLGVLQVKTGLSWSDLLAGIAPDEDSSAIAPQTGDEETPPHKRFGFSLISLQSLWNPGKSKEIQHQFRQNCLKFCLQRLSPELRLRFANLGLLPHNLEISPPIASMIWELSIPESRQRLQLLTKQGFLCQGHMDAAQGQSYRLHPVMRDIARWLITVPQNSAMPGLGLTWAAAHQKFLERYRPQLQDGQWNTVSDDSYIHAHLFWHLEQAGWRGEIHQILQAFNEWGRNAWFDRCNELGLSTNFPVDLGRAWHLAKGVYDDAPEHSTGLQIRYALTSSFVYQVQGQPSPRSEIDDRDSPPAPLLLPPDRLLEDWAFTKILLKAARYLPDLASKVIKSTFYPSTLDQASKEQTIFELLNNVYQDSPDMAVELTEHLLSSSAAIDALIRLAPERPCFCLPLLRLLQERTDETHLVTGVACLAKIGEHKLHPELYALLPKIAHPLDRLLILEQLQDRLPEALTQRASEFRQDCLKNLAARRQGLGKLPLDYGSGLGARALETTTQEYLELYDQSGWAIALAFEQHPSTRLDEAFQQIMASRSEEKRSKGLSFLIPNLSDAHRHEIWESHTQFSDPICKVKVLGQLLPFHPDALSPLITTLKLFENPKKLDLLFRTLPGSREIIEEILKTIAALSQPKDRWPHLERVLPHVSSDTFSRFIEVIQETPFDADGVVQILTHLAPSQSALASGIVELVETIPPVYERATALNLIAPHLPPESRAHALEIATRIQFPYARVVALQNFIPSFPDMAQEAIAALKNCHEESPNDLYEFLIPVLPDEERIEAIELIASIEDLRSKLQRLIRTLPYQATLIDEIQSLVQDHPDLQDCCELGPVLDELHRICRADLATANSNPPQTLELIVSTLPLVHWSYSPVSPVQTNHSERNSSENRFCQIFQDYLAHPSHNGAPAVPVETLTSLLDFFVLIPHERQRSETLEMLFQVAVKATHITAMTWFEWLEKLSRYAPYEFHWILSSMLPALMSFSDSNTLNQTLQSIRSVREQWK